MRTRFFKTFWLFLLLPLFAHSSTICPPDAKNTAVVIIDMQPAFVKSFTKGTESPDNEKFKKLVEEQKALIAYAKSQNLEIIYIENQSSGPTFGALTDATTNYGKVSSLLKTADGMLDEKSLYRDQVWTHLEKNKIGKLIVAGVNGNSCVKESIYGALRGNCSVMAYLPGIASVNRREMEYARSYSGYFNNPRCRSCTFQEIESMDQLKDVMSEPVGTVKSVPAKSADGAK